MHTVPLRQFRNRRILAQRLQRDLRLERRIKLDASNNRVLSRRMDSGDRPWVFEG
jgi:hypothetical protein